MSRLVLIVSGGIAAYKSLELIRLARAAGHQLRCVLTEGGARFVTPLSLQALSEHEVYTDLWSLTEESRMGHIRLSREADLIVVAPASADLLARMAAGLASDLASTVLLATDAPVLVAPAMNVRMWAHPATVANMAALRARGVRVVGPGIGAMACNETGPGRLAEPPEILGAIEAMLEAGRREAGRDAALGRGRLAGRHVLVTAGPTREKVDAVRYLGNRSSGRQGYAIAAACAAAGARVSLITGPVALPPPPGIVPVRVETAEQMLRACEAALPADAAVLVAAVADWRVAEPAAGKLDKRDGPPALRLEATPDILARLAAAGPDRPFLVVGFAAETGEVAARAVAKRARKGCDWILGNDVGPDASIGADAPQGAQAANGGEAWAAGAAGGTAGGAPGGAPGGAMGGLRNRIHFVDAGGVEAWPEMSKTAIGEKLAGMIAAALDAAGPAPGSDRLG